VARELSRPVGADPPLSAEAKARRYYQTCLGAQHAQDRESLLSLQAVVDYAGGWNLTGASASLSSSTDGAADISLEERLHLVHNRLGLEALFQWGIVEHSGTYKLGVIAGGWDQGMLSAAAAASGDGQNGDYLKLMCAYVLLLAQAADDQTVELQMPSEDLEVDGEDAIQIVEYDHYGHYYDDEKEEAVVGGPVSNASDKEPIVAGLLKVLNPFGWLHEENSTDSMRIEEVPLDDAHAAVHGHHTEGAVDYQSDESSK